MKKPAFMILAVLISGVAVAGIYYFLFRSDELASKTEWSVVQAVEWQHREHPGTEIEIVHINKYMVVGVPVPDKRKEIWVLLNPKASPFYKQIPEGNFSISSNDLKTILDLKIVSPTVENCLESHAETEHP